MENELEAFQRRFGAVVRQLRTERNWSQVELADLLTRLGVPMHQTTIAKMEKGNRPTPLTEVYALGKAFQMTAESIVYLSSNPDPRVVRHEANEQRIAGLMAERHRLRDKLAADEAALSYAEMSARVHATNIAAIRSRLDALDAEVAAMRAEQTDKQAIAAITAQAASRGRDGEVAADG